MRTAIISLTENGLKISERIAEGLGGCGRYAFEKHCGNMEPLIKSFHDALSNGFSSVGNDGFAFDQRFLKAYAYCKIP